MVDQILSWYTLDSSKNVQSERYHTKSYLVIDVFPLTLTNKW